MCAEHNKLKETKMTQKMFAIYDNKASFFMSPWLCRNDGIARREFASACSDPKTPFAKYPADFVLHEIGSFDDHDAVLVSITPPLLVS